MRALPYTICLRYHAIPSLPPLHCHIVSQDLSSVHLKHKKHWNSFASPFFVDTAAVEAQLLSHGTVAVDR